MATSRSSDARWATADEWAGDALDLLSWSSTHTLSSRLAERLRAVEPETLELLRRKKIDGLWHLAAQDDSPEQRVYDKVWGAQRMALLDVLDDLGAAGVDPLIFKGAEALEASYEGHAISLIADLDLLVQRGELGTVKQVLYRAGFRQLTFHSPSGTFVDRDVAELAAMEANHYELAPFNRLQPIALEDDECAVVAAWNEPKVRTIGGAQMMLVEVDVHHGIATDVGSEDLFARAVPSSFGKARTFCDADHVWFLTSRFYNEVAMHGKDSLRDFAYILPILRRGTVEWPVVLAVAADLDLRPSLYYYLHFMNALAGSAIPADVLEKLCPTRGSRLRDWGWQLGRLFGVVDRCPFEVD